MEWSKEKIDDLIDLYQEWYHNNDLLLWNTKHIGYKDRRENISVLHYFTREKNSKQQK